TVVMVLHDLNLAARYADHLVALRAGRVAAAGPPGEVLTEDLLAEVFGLGAKVISDPISGGPLVVPLGGQRQRAADQPSMPRS
ncbi:MAG: ABC transporter ATP-binding protein, partial [Actinomadura sp.]